MSKTAVVYKSKYGSAQRYAHWIADAVGGEVFKATDIKAEDLIGFDVIVYCGGVYVGSVSGFSLIKKNYAFLSRKKLIVVAVGLSSNIDRAAETAIKRNFTPEMRGKVPLFAIRGAIDYAKMNKLDKFLMSVIVKVLKGKKPEELDEDVKVMIETHNKTVDYANKDSIQPIVAAVKS